MRLKWKILLLTLAVLLYGWWELKSVTSPLGYAPEQPLPFSHKLHAGENKIPCLYCHANAERSRHATVPSMNICMGCHQVVATSKPAIVKLTEMYKKGESPEWIRVHSVPDFGYFSHRWHVAKGIACQTCHGPVEQMERVVQSRLLKMGDCVTCHRQNNAPTDCNTCHN